MHVQQITSVLTSPTGEPWTFDLTEKVLITGRNGSHKSSIPIAVQLALSHEADGIDGRANVKDHQVLIDLAPADELWCQAKLSNGEEAIWGIRRVDGVVKATDPVRAPSASGGVFPLRDVREVLTSDVKIARRKFLTWVGATKTQEDVLAAVPTHLHERYRAIVQAKAAAPDAPDTPVAMLANIAEYARARVLEIERDAKAHDTLIAQLRPEGVRPSDEEVAAAERQVALWHAAYVAAVAYEAWTAAHTSTVAPVDTVALAAEISAADAAWQQWEAMRVAAEAVVVSAVPEPAGLERVRAAIALLALAPGEEMCPACSSTVGARHLEACHVFYTGVQQRTLEESAVARSAVETANQERLQAIARTTEGAAAWDREAKRLRALWPTPATAPTGEAPPNPNMTSAHAAENERQAQVTLTQVQAQRTAWDQLRRARDAAAALRADKPAFEDLATNCQKAVGELLQQQEADFTARVQRWLGDNYTFGMSLGTDARPRLKFGLMQPGPDGTLVLRSYKSGAEGEILRVALTMAVCELSGKVRKGADTPLRIVIPEDRRVDSENLKAQMRAWGKFKGQVILEATEKPAGKLPPGWQHIDMDAWLAGLKKGASPSGDEKGGGDELVAQGSGGQNPGEPVVPAVSSSADVSSSSADVPSSEAETPSPAVAPAAPAAVPAAPAAVPAAPAAPAAAPVTPAAPVRSIAEAVAALPPPPGTKPATQEDLLRSLGHDPDAVSAPHAVYLAGARVPAARVQWLDGGVLRILNKSGDPEVDLRPDGSAWPPK